MLLSSFFLYTFYVYSKLRSLQHLLMMLTVVFSKHRSRWWCCISKMSSFVSLSSLPLAARAAILASAAFFLETKAAPEVALAICIRASRAFWNSNQKSLVRIIKAILYDIFRYDTNSKLSYQYQENDKNLWSNFNSIAFDKRMSYHVS